MITTVTLNTAVDKLYIIDKISRGTVSRVEEVQNTAGGKGLNVARVASLYGEDTMTTGFIGGHNGELFTSLITQPNIKTNFSKTSSETRCCINVFDKETNSNTEFLEPGSPVTEENLKDFLETYKESIKDSAVVAISGSTPKGTPTTFYGDLIKIAKDMGKKVILDTSGENLIQSVKSLPTVVKPNTDEIAQLLGREINSTEELIEASLELHQSGIEIVAISLGKDGVLLTCSEGVFKSTPPKITPVNTVGCGDSMVAGFSIALANGYSIEELIRFSTAIATANALTSYTGYFEKNDLDKILPLVKVEKIK